MPEYRAIGELIAPILKRAAEFAGVQSMLAALDSDSERKRLILEWWERRLISDDEAEMLISAHMLEDA